MLTVKWVAQNGSEMIYEAKSDVSYTPGHVRQESTPEDIGNKACIAFYGPDEVHCTIDSGEVFVMNQKGSTVARYVLSTASFPHGIAPRQHAA